MRHLAAVFSLSLLLATAACEDDVVDQGTGAGGTGGSTGSSSNEGGDVTNPLEKAQLGDPKLVSAQRLEFGPGGVLLIGDGRSDRVIAVETGDTSPEGREENIFGSIDNLTGAAAAAIGDDITAAELQIDDIAVNPISWRTYVAVTRFTTLEAFVLWTDADESLHLFDLSNVVHAVVDVSVPEGPSSVIADMSWGDMHVITGVTPQTFVGGSIAFTSTPFKHEGGVRLSTTRIYNRLFAQWTNDDPMEHFFTYTEGSDVFLAGSFTGTVVRFAVQALQGGRNNVNGATVFEIGDGRSVVDFVPYSTADGFSVLVTVFNLFFDGLTSAAVVDGSLFTEVLLINEQSPILFDIVGNPLVPGVERAPDFDGATRIARINDQLAVVFRANAIGAVPLP